MLLHHYQFNVLSEMAKFYELGQFHDLEIICGSPPDLQNPVWCHKIVIALISPLKMGPVLHENDFEIGEPQSLFLPDFETGQVLSWIQDLYQLLKKKPDMALGKKDDITLDPTWAEFLGLNVWKSPGHDSPATYGDFGLQLKLKELHEDENIENVECLKEQAYGDFYAGGDMEEVFDGDIEQVDFIENIQQDVMLKLEPMVKIENLNKEMLAKVTEPILRKSHRQKELNKVNETKMLEDIKIREKRLNKKSVDKNKHNILRKRKSGENEEKKDKLSPPKLEKKIFLDDFEDFELFPVKLEEKIEMANGLEDKMDPTYDSDFNPTQADLKMTNKKTKEVAGSKKLDMKEILSAGNSGKNQTILHTNDKTKKFDEEFRVPENKIMNEAFKKKHIRSNKIKNVPKEDSSDDEDVEPSLNIVYERFRESDNKINVTIDRTPISEDHINVYYKSQSQKEIRKKRLYYRTMFFGKKNYLKRCLLGVRKILGKNTYECKPLVSGDMQKKHILGHFDKVLDLMRNKFGLSMKQMLLDRKVRKKASLGLNLDPTYNIGYPYKSLNGAQKVTKGLFDQYHELPSEELNLIKKSSIAKLEALDSRPEKSRAKNKVNILPGSNINLILNENMSESDFDGFVLMMWRFRPNNELFCHTIDFKRDESWVLLLIDIWSRQNKDFFSRSRTIQKKIKDIYELTRIPDVIDSILTQAQKEGKKDFSSQKFENKTVVCPDCGIVFPTNNREERSKYNSHKNRHDFEKIKCSCNMKFANKKEKRMHMRLFHREDKNFVACEICNEVVQEVNLASHVETNHSNYLCTECGLSYNDLTRYNTHVQNHHDLKKCEECGLEFHGYSRLRKHKAAEHPQKSACEICSKVCVSTIQLNKHRRQMHSNPKDMAYQCKFCTRGYIKKSMLQCHMINMHLKTRPFKCGYGCGMDYNDISNRNSHEKKKHDGIFPSREPERLDDYCPIENARKKIPPQKR